MVCQFGLSGTCTYKKGELAFASSSGAAPWGTPYYYILAERTGLEPATPGVTGRYSNQLNYHSSLMILIMLLVGTDGIEPPTFAL